MEWNPKSHIHNTADRSPETEELVTGNREDSTTAVHMAIIFEGVSWNAGNRKDWATRGCTYGNVLEG